MERLPSMESTGTAPKLMGQVRGKMRLKRCSPRIELSYTDSIKRFIRHFGKGHSAEIVLREC